MKTIIVLLILPVLFSCSRFKEIHYFKDKAPYPSNYYRLKIKGYAFATRSRYLSGYFDDEAVDRFFNEITPSDTNRPIITQPVQRAEDNSSTSATVGSEVQSLSKPLENKRLVFMLSTNSDAISTQIGQLAENEEILKAVIGLTSQERIAEITELESTYKIQTSHRQSLVTLGEQLMGTLDANSTAAQIDAVMLQYLNALAVELGNTTPFEKIEAARTWLNTHRSIVINR